VGVVSLFALGLAFDAHRQAGNVRSQLDSVFPTQVPAPTATATDPPPVEPATGSPPSEAPTPPDVLNPQAVYSPVFAGDVLNPQVTGDSDAYIDLDEPRVGADFNRADIVISLPFSGPVPTIQLMERDQAAAEAGNPAVTPEDCAELIRTGPLPQEATVPAQRGTILCITTSPTQAAAQGINQRMVVLRVTALGDDGRMSLEVSAWEVPR
jgi:hypothetical protein